MFSIKKHFLKSSLFIIEFLWSLLMHPSLKHLSVILVATHIFEIKLWAKLNSECFGWNNLHHQFKINDSASLFTNSSGWQSLIYWSDCPNVFLSTVEAAINASFPGSIGVNWLCFLKAWVLGISRVQKMATSIHIISFFICFTES